MTERLQALGCRVSVLSYDPLAESSPLFTEEEDLHVGLFRPRRYSRLYAPRSGGIVSVRDGLDILRGYFACCRIRTANRLGVLLSWLWVIAAGGLTVASPAIGLPADALPLLCCLWYTVTAGLSCLPALLCVRRAAPGKGARAAVKRRPPATIHKEVSPFSMNRERKTHDPRPRYRNPDATPG